MLLHCCCAPCACYALEYFSSEFRITTLFYNPNIRPREEYYKRAAELVRLLSLTQYKIPADSMDCGYDAAAFTVSVAPYQDQPEGGLRCKVCFELRLGETAARAKAGGFDCFATTLSVSPHKNAKLINGIGEDLAKSHQVAYLPADLKKKGGYLRSIELSKQHGLYRQSYCGCDYRLQVQRFAQE